MTTLAESQAQFVGHTERRRAPAAAATRLLHAVLFLTIAISSFVFVEPSPYEFVAILLGLACVLARVSLDRTMLPLVVLLVIWMAGGVIAVVDVLDQEKTGRYVLISLFMAFTAIVYAGLFSRDTMRRLAIMQRAYVLAAVFAAIIGIIGYFNAFPGAGALFTSYGRASSTFKDPNVYGPFLIFPLLLLVQSALKGKLRFREIVALAIILFGLFLSFSRGAWFHFAASAVVMVLMMFVTAPDARTRAHLSLLTVLGLCALVGLAAFALSFESISSMFQARAQLIQSYDAGSSMGRFNLQRLAVDAVLDNPLGLGPFEFVRLHGLQQHNVYLQAFLVYGWMGGAAYVALLLVTIFAGLRAALMSTPWQAVLIVAFATLIGEIMEGAIIDSDHWRHFYLLIGIVWGLFAATIRLKRQTERERRSPAAA